MASAIEEEILINLVGEHKQVMPDSQIGNSLQFIEMKNLARRIARRIDNDGAGAGRDRTAQSVKVKLPIRRRQRDRNRLYPKREQRVDVITVERFEKNDLITRIEQRKTGGIQRSRGSRCHQYLGVRIGRDAVVTFQFGRDCLP